MVANKHNNPKPTSFESRFKEITGFAYPPKNEDQWNSVLTYAGYSLLECQQVLNTLGYPGYAKAGKLPDPYLSKYKNATKNQQLTFAASPSDGVPLFGPDLLRRLERAAEQDGHRQMLSKTSQIDNGTAPHTEQAERPERTVGRETKWSRSTSPVSKDIQQKTWLALAVLLVRDHPDWSDAEIARQIDKAPSTLSRNPEFRLAAKLARSPKTSQAQGHVVNDSDLGMRDVEAYSDDPAERDWDD